MWKFIVIALVAAIGVVLIYAGTKPDTFGVQRRATIQAPPEKIYALVNDLQQFVDSARGSDLPWANAQLFKTRIRRNIKLAESPSFGQTIFQYEPTSNGAQDYRSLAREVIALYKPHKAPAAAQPDESSAPAKAAQTQSETEPNAS